MASLYITEYERLAEDGAGRVLPLPAEPPVRTQKVTFTTTTASLAFRGNTRFIRIYADAEFHAEVESAPVATTASPLRAADTEYFLAVKAGDKIAAVAA